MPVTASDIITHDIIEDRVEEILSEAEIYDSDIQYYQNKHDNEVVHISAAGYNVKVEMDYAKKDPIDEFAVELDNKLRNLIMSAAPKMNVDGHEVIISKDNRGLVAKCNLCGVSLSMSEHEYERMDNSQQELAKKWAVGFFAEN